MADPRVPIGDRARASSADGDLDAHAAAILAHAPDPMLLVTDDGAVLASNVAAQRVLDRTAEEITREGRAGLVVNDEAFRRFFEERSRTGRARAILSLRRKDGTTFLAEVASVSFAGEAGAKWVSLAFRDVTEVERARRAVEILADAGGRLGRSLDPKKTLEELTALVVPKLADVCTVDLLDHEGVSRVAIAHRDPQRIEQFRHVRRRKINASADSGADFVLRTGKPSAVYEVTDEWLRHATHDQSHYEEALALDVRSFVSVPLCVGERVIGALTLMSTGGVPVFSERDLSFVSALGERAAIAIDNARAHEEAIDARRLRDEVLSVVAHDLRSPLNVIQLAASTLARQRSCEETDSIMRAVRRANVLIQDLLLATKTERATLPLERQQESVASILDEVHALYAPIALARGVHLDVVIDGDRELATANVDRHRVIQMLSNVVANAVDVTSADGRVVLAATSDADRICFRISDTGPGISAEDLERIFDRFWQTARRRRTGAGLGLTIAQAVATAHGGDITAESELGRGTTFTIVIPRHGGAAA